MDGLERVMSVLIYLIEPEEGGETAFPNSNGKCGGWRGFGGLETRDSSSCCGVSDWVYLIHFNCGHAGWLHPEMGEPAQGPFSPCARNHVAYKPKQGDALMFYDLKPDYRQGDPFSTHTGCPVIKGVKWNAVKWIHGKPFRGEDLLYRWPASLSFRTHWVLFPCAYIEGYLHLQSSTLVQVKSMRSHG
jgi:prolyl 4-hydroxylase